MTTTTAAEPRHTKHCSCCKFILADSSGYDIYVCSGFRSQGCIIARYGNGVHDYCVREFRDLQQMIELCRTGSARPDELAMLKALSIHAMRIFPFGPYEQEEEQNGN